MEQKMRWFISKQRGGKILIHKILGDESYNGQRIPIQQEDKQELRSIVCDKHHKTLEQSQVALTVNKRFDKELYDDLTKFIARKLYNIRKTNPDLYNVVRSEKIPCYYNGLCMLLRSASKDKIWIAFRKTSEKFPRGYTNLNHVCIDDAEKKRFFDDADYYHTPDGRIHYVLASDGYVFKKWSDFMDAEYEEQLKRSKMCKCVEKELDL